MGRFVFLVLLLAACPKKETEDELEPLGKAPASGRSVTKSVEDEADGSGSGSGGLRAKLQGMAGSNGSGEGSGEEGSDTKTKVAAAGSGEGSGKTTTGSRTGDAKLWGGNGAAPYYDDEGHLHGPGGPVFMGKGPECNAERDHCMRPEVWFSVENMVPGKLYRATPIYEYEKKWYNWRGKEISFSNRFKTKVATKDAVRAGEPIIWFIDENSSKKFTDNEYDALTSSRWELGYVERWEGDKVRVKGWTYGTVFLDTIRVITETK